MKDIRGIKLSRLPDYLLIDFKVTAEVINDGGYNLLSIEIIDRSTPNKDYYGLTFNVDWADEYRIEWLASVLLRNLTENIWEAKKNQRQYIQSAAYQFGKAIGLDIHKHDPQP